MNQQLPLARMFPRGGRAGRARVRRLAPILAVALGAAISCVALAAHPASGPPATMPMQGGPPEPGAAEQPPEPMPGMPGDPAMMPPPPAIVAQPAAAEARHPAPPAPPATLPATLPAPMPATAPATAPASGSSSYHHHHYHSRSAVAAVDTVLPPELQILDQRSIFSRDKRAVAAAMDERDEEPTTTPVEHHSTPTAQIVLTGVVVASPTIGGAEEYEAVFEDIRAGKAFTLRAKDPVATGRIADITLDYVDFEAAGKLQRVYIGENLDGLPGAFSQAINSGNSTSASGGPANASTGSSSSGGAAPAGSTTQETPSGASESVLERLRARRAREGG